MRQMMHLTVLLLGLTFKSAIGAGDFPIGHLRNPAQSCFEILSRTESKDPPASGVYWFQQDQPSPYNPPYYSSGLYQTYCDMITEGGGWMLIGRITDDYSWICPDQRGAACFGSSTTAPPSHGNFWHDIHSRLFLEPEFVSTGADSGVHLPRSCVQRLFENGLHSLRFSFYEGRDLTGAPANDAVARFLRPVDLFHETERVALQKGQDYEFRILRHANASRTSFSGDRLCWLPTNSMRSQYEGGLFLGKYGFASCHLANDVSEVMLKSHYTYQNGEQWYTGRHSFLRANALQVHHDAIMLWVR